MMKRISKFQMGGPGLVAATIMAAGLVLPVPHAQAATFGTVVPIGGHAADIALDESRGVAYVANFGAGRIDLVSLAEKAVTSAIPVAPYPGSLALSADGQYLLIAHFGNFTAPSSPANALTLVNLVTGGKQTFTMGDPPLAVGFGADGQALVVTTTQFLLFDPASGAIHAIDTIAGVTARTLPVPPATFPPQIVAASIGVSDDGLWMYGITDTLRFRYDVANRTVRSAGYTSDPPQGPRVVSVSRDGHYFTAGWGVFDSTGRLLAEFPNPSGQLNVGSHAIDSAAGLIYAQIPQAGSQSTTGGAAPTVQPPILMVADADNLTVRERLFLPENLAGRSLLNAARNTMYSVSDSGLLILPVGSLTRAHRIRASREDLVFRGSFCDRRPAIEDFTLSDPGGGHTDFSVASDTAGITLSASSGSTPATLHVSVDPSAFRDQQGTVTAWLHISSRAAVNLPPDVRVLINNRAPEQRGTMVDVPGKLVDILADPARNRFYILRQDTNQILVFDSASHQQIAVLRTGSTPTQMAFSFDQHYLLVGHDNSQFAYVYDLASLNPLAPIAFPPGHYPRSIASSGYATLAASRVAGPAHTIDRIDLVSHTASTPDTLGMFANSINVNTVLAAASNGSSILAAMPDGTVMRYDASVDAFTASRKDFASLAGAYAASDSGYFVADNHLLDSSLVPIGDFDNSTGASSGFAFVDQTGFRTTAMASQSPGVIERIDLAQVAAVRPSGMAEAPRTGDTAFVFTRTLAPLADHSAIISLTVSGFTALAWNYDAAVAAPSIQSVVNAADDTSPVAPGGLVTVWGSQLSPANIATSEIPVPTALADSCLTVNGTPVPMLFASPEQINAQLPFEVEGNATLTLHTPGGTSNDLNFTVLPTAPSVFRSGSAGPVHAIPTVVRAKNNQLATVSNPIHRDDTIVIYATGLGSTFPAVGTGMAAPSDPLPSAILQPTVSLGGVALPVIYAGLAPGEVGVYQINARVPGWTPTGMQVPLIITQGSTSTTLTLRVVD